MIPHECPLTDRVVATFHDGAPEQEAFPSLSEHLAQCGTCTQALGAARRVDALVAGTTLRPGREMTRALLARALAEAPSTLPPRRPHVPRAVLLASGVLVLAMLALVLAPHREAAVPAGSTGPAEVAQGPAAVLRVPDLPPGVRATFAAPRAVEPEPATALARFVRTPSTAMVRGLARELGVATLAPESRAELRELAALLERGVGDRSVATLRSALHEGEDDFELVRLCARVPHAGLLRALRSAVRGDATLSRVAARAALDNPRAAPALDLLFGLWNDLQVRDASLGRETIARQWFAALPTAWTPALLECLARSVNPEQRERCLLAIAATETPTAVGALRALVQGPRHEEALLAAFALARCLPPQARLHDLRPTWSAAIRARPTTLAEFLKLAEVVRVAPIETE